MVYKKTNGYCQYCGKKFDIDGNWQIEHIIPKAQNGTNAFSNLTLACVRCNSIKKDCIPTEFAEHLKVRFIKRINKYIYNPLVELLNYYDDKTANEISTKYNELIDLIFDKKIVFYFFRSEDIEWHQDE